jgi:hypothetical protein
LPRARSCGWKLGGDALRLIEPISGRHLSFADNRKR